MLLWFEIVKLSFIFYRFFLLDRESSVRTLSLC